MKLETFKSKTKETFVESDEFTVTVADWSNLEGCNLIVHGKNLSLRMAGSFRWEEIDVIITALAAARSS